MKKITMGLALIVATMAASCQKDDISESSGSEQQADAAYVSITISTPSTRADGDTVDGSGDENKVFSLSLIAFDKNYDYIDAYQIYADADDKLISEVAPDARRFFAVVNPTKEIQEAIAAVSSFDQAAFSSLPAIALSAASVSTENYQTGSTTNTRGFTMVNSGSKNSSGILLESLVSVDTELSTKEDSPTAVNIEVDRLVSKFSYSVSSSLNVVNGNGAVLGVALTARNKATFLYSMILTDELTQGNVYRTDHNMSVGQALIEAEAIRAEMTENFYWLSNMDEDSDKAFIAPAASEASSTPEYVLENTCLASYSNSNNLTQAVVKAQYTPLKTTAGADFVSGESWFRVNIDDGNGLYYLTFAEVIELYDDNYNSITLDQDIKDSMDKQLQNILGNDAVTWDDGSFTLADLDERPYGGYLAATVDGDESDYIIQYYQNAINYYDIFIQHDNSLDIGHVGRWGMVRNNSYSMSVTGINQEGLPFIPDPTDPDIVDPDNPSPTNPEPADQLDTYISAVITVNPWVMWSQESALE